MRDRGTVFITIPLPHYMYCLNNDNDQDTKEHVKSHTTPVHLYYELVQIRFQYVYWSRPLIYLEAIYDGF